MYGGFRLSDFERRFRMARARQARRPGGGRSGLHDGLVRLSADFDGPVV